MLQRILETEAMDSVLEAEEYDAMDDGGVNERFAEDFIAAGATADWTLDLGTGTALIPLVLCGHLAGVRVVAVDYAGEMLRVARRNILQRGAGDRIVLVHADAKRLPFPDGSFSQVMSNSIVHHLAEPELVFREAWRVLRPGGLVFFRDLFRPPDAATLHDLVERYAGSGTPQQKKMFADSLHASLTVEEVRGIVASCGWNSGRVQATSDRHWTWIARKPAA
ncbi:MAG: class I SAM-dependent methyltransferase [Thermogutta sp.]|nr:class I SAM-dependent methyltransferase [Thermogutta sp.]